MTIYMCKETVCFYLVLEPFKLIDLIFKFHNGKMKTKLKRFVTSLEAKTEKCHCHYMIKK